MSYPSGNLTYLFPLFFIFSELRPADALKSQYPYEIYLLFGPTT